MTDEILDDSPMPISPEEEERIKREEKYSKFMIKPDQIEDLWNAEDPCQVAQDHINEYLDAKSKGSGKNINAYNENEKRYEPNQELKILADYVVNGLVVIKQDLSFTDADACADLLQILWDTLNFLDYNPKTFQEAVQSRFDFLLENVQEMFSRKQITKSQVKIVMDYMHRILFSNLHLYLKCLKSKQARRDKPIQIMASVPQKAVAGGLESKDCKEINDQEEGIPNVDQPNPEGTVDGMSQQREVEAQDQEAAEEEENLIIDKDDPLYGLQTRLKHSNLDDDTKDIIKQKLFEAQEKIKEQLVARQTNLETKLAGAGKKK